MNSIKKLSIVLVLLVLAPVMKGEPYIAMRTGYKCAQCHVNRTGGGMRTGFGFTYTQTKLAAFLLGTEESGSFFTNVLNENVSVGANFRVGNKTIVGTDSTRNIIGQDADPRFDNSITIPEANIYLQVDAVPERMMFYIDETFAPGAASREAFAMIYNLPMNGYLKFGRIMMPFGLRLIDDGSDGSYIRSKTGFDSYGRQESAYEIGIEPGPFSLITAVANGMDQSAVDKQITTVGSVVFRRFRIGGSYSFNKGDEETEHVYGLFAGGNFGRFTLMWEQDYFKKVDTKTGEGLSDYGNFEIVGDQFMSYASLDVYLYRGINLKISYDYFDPRTLWSEDSFDRWTFGLELFPVQFLQTSVYYRYRTAPDLDIYNSENEDQLFFELQFFF